MKLKRVAPELYVIIINLNNTQKKIITQRQILVNDNHSDDEYP